MKTHRTLLLAFCTLFLALVPLRATTVIPPTFDQLVGEAELIFQGTVTDVKSQWTGEGAQRHIVSYVTLKVEDAIKGDPGASYTIRMLGGTVDGQTMEVTDTPKFKVGEREILFVEHNGTQFVPLVGIMHGRFRVTEDKTTGTDVVLTNSGQAVTDLAQLGKQDYLAHTDKDHASTDAASAKTLDTNSFKSAVRAKLGNAAR